MNVHACKVLICPVAITELHVDLQIKVYDKIFWQVTCI